MKKLQNATKIWWKTSISMWIVSGGDLSRVEGRSVKPHWTLLFSDILLFAKVSRDRVLFITEEPIPLANIVDSCFNIRKKRKFFNISCIWFQKKMDFFRNELNFFQTKKNFFFSWRNLDFFEKVWKLFSENLTLFWINHKFII